jgi:NAD(P)H-flavin reductase
MAASSLMPQNAGPAALLAAGIGVTPLLAMLRHIVYEGIRTRRFRPTWFSMRPDPKPTVPSIPS